MARGSINLAVLAAVAAATIPAGALARESLGLFDGWAAFRDRDVPRCYAIAKAAPSNLRRDYEPYATVGHWPNEGIRAEVHFRLSREMARSSTISLDIGDREFLLTGGGGDAWARDKTMNAAILAAMRSAASMKIAARDDRGQSFSNSYDLRGASNAVDAAARACAKL